MSTTTSSKTDKTTGTTTDATPTATTHDAAPPGRWRLPSTLRHGATLAWRGLVKTVGSPEALIDVTLQPIIFLLLFVYVFGGAISGDPASYLQFALPGVLVQTVVFASAGTGTGLADDLKTGIFDRFRSLPISRAAPLLGAIGADLVRYLVSGLIMLGFGMILGFRFTGGPLAVLATLGLVIAMAFALCWVFTTLAMIVREPRSVQGIGALIMLPITFGSNVFVPADTMPSWLRGFVEVNPVSKVADAARGLLTGGAVAAPATAALIAIAVITAVFAPLAVVLYQRRT
jgi:oleandomycin transport system permease protein